MRDDQIDVLGQARQRIAELEASNERLAGALATGGGTVASRLEAVRVSRSIESLRAFHGVMLRGWDDPLSYEAARKYHYQGREPSVRYLVRVSDVFNVDLYWLATGKARRDPWREWWELL